MLPATQQTAAVVIAVVAVVTAVATTVAQVSAVAASAAVAVAPATTQQSKLPDYTYQKSRLPVMRAGFFGMNMSCLVKNGAMPGVSVQVFPYVRNGLTDVILYRFDGDSQFCGYLFMRKALYPAHPEDKSALSGHRTQRFVNNVLYIA